MEKPVEEKDNDSLELDLDVASGMTKMFLRQPKAREFISQMGQDPNALAQIAANTLIKTREALIGEQLEVDDQVWVMGNGVLDEVLEDVAEGIGIPDDQSGAQFLFQAREKAMQILEEYEGSQGQGGEQASPAPGGPTPMGGALGAGPAEGGAF